jgi:plasmid stabilization system protein ParE
VSPRPRLPEALAERIRPLNGRRIQSLLQDARWLWPRDAADRESLARYYGVAMPPPRPGVVPLSTASHDAGAISRLDVAPARGAYSFAFQSDSLDAWDTALRWLSTATPVLVSTPRTAGVREELRGLHHFASPHDRHTPVVGGRSLGLAFTLLLVSAANRLPLPDGVIGIAALDRDDPRRLEAVDPDYLHRKLEAIARGAPGLWRIVAHPGNADVFDEFPALEVGLFEDVRDAVCWAFTEQSGPPGADALVRTVMSRELERVGEARASALADQLFALGLQATREELMEWAPLRRAAEWLLRRDEQAAAALDPDAHHKLRALVDICRGHDAVPGPALGLPTEDQLRGLRYYQWRTRLLAHTVQHAATRAQPEPTAVRALVHAFGVPDLDRSDIDELHLHGALARLDAVDGDPRVALDAQMKIARIWRQRLEPDALAQNASFQLCEWFRLAGALGDRDAFVEATRYFDTHAVSPGRLGGKRYVLFGRARGAVFLEEWEIALADAEALWLRSPQNARLGVAAARVVHHVAQRCPEAAPPWDPRAHVRALAAKNPAARALVPTFDALVDLDAAVLAGDTAAATEALERLDQVDLGFVGLLRARAKRLGEPEAEHVHRYYPY